jgi:hypothetical protein
VALIVVASAAKFVPVSFVLLPTPCIQPSTSNDCSSPNSSASNALQASKRVIGRAWNVNWGTSLKFRRWWISIAISIGNFFYLWFWY